MDVTGDAGQAWLAFLPYKLQLAAVLADYGQVSRALHYCALVDTAIRAAVASKGGPASTGGIPPFLLVMTSQLESLRERLSVHAAAHNIKVSSSESAIAKVGRFFDKAITNLMWGSDAAAGPQAAAAAAGRPAGAAVAGSGPYVVDTVGVEYQPPPTGMGVHGGGVMPGSEQYGVVGASWMQQPAAAMSGPSSKEAAVASPAAAVPRNGSWTHMFRGTNTAAGSGFNSPSHAGGMQPMSTAGSGALPPQGAGVIPGAWGGLSNSTVPAAATWEASAGQRFTSGAVSSSAGPATGSTGPSSFTAGVSGGPGAPGAGPPSRSGVNSTGHMPGFTGAAGQGQGGLAVQNGVGPSGPASGSGAASHRRTGSQLSNMSGAAVHSRTPSYDVSAGAAGLAPGAATSMALGAAQLQGPEKPVGTRQEAAAAAAAPSTAAAGSSKSGGGAGKSSWLTGVVSSVLGVKGPPVAKLGLENEFYFCEKRQVCTAVGHQHHALASLTNLIWLHDAGSGHQHFTALYEAVIAAQMVVCYLLSGVLKFSRVHCIGCNDLQTAVHICMGVLHQPSAAHTTPAPA